MIYLLLQQHHHKQENAHNIFLVDDEPDTLFTYKTFLLDIESCNVDAFTESQEALQHFAQVNPSYYDLVVMDIRSIVLSPNSLVKCNTKKIRRV